MADRFQNKYRKESMRAAFWDYGSNGAYFVTICTQNRECYFGDVVNGEMALSEIGEIANWCWLKIPDQFPFAKLDQHIVMPNHMHGILIIDKSMAGTDAINRVSAGGITGDKNPMLHENLGRIIRWYKGRTTFESRKIHSDFQWQSLYHDRIIRNNRAFKNIARYIQNNPKKWAMDQLFGH